MASKNCQRAEVPRSIGERSEVNSPIGQQSIRHFGQTRLRLHQRARGTCSLMVSLLWRILRYPAVAGCATKVRKKRIEVISAARFAITAHRCAEDPARASQNAARSARRPWQPSTGRGSSRHARSTSPPPTRPVSLRRWSASGSDQFHIIEDLVKWKDRANGSAPASAQRRQSWRRACAETRPPVRGAVINPPRLPRPLRWRRLTATRGPSSPRVRDLNPVPVLINKAHEDPSDGGQAAANPDARC